METLKNYKEAKAILEKTFHNQLLIEINSLLDGFEDEEKIPVSHSSSEYGKSIPTGEFSDCINYITKEGLTDVYNNEDCGGNDYAHLNVEIKHFNTELLSKILESLIKTVEGKKKSIKKDVEDDFHKQLGRINDHFNEGKITLLEYMKTVRDLSAAAELKLEENDIKN